MSDGTHIAVPAVAPALGSQHPATVKCRAGLARTQSL